MFKETFICILIATGFVFLNFLFPHSNFNFVAAFFFFFGGVLLLYSAVALLEIIWSPQWDFLRQKIHAREQREKLILMFKKPPR